MAATLESRNLANPVGYTDLRTLIDVDPPMYGYDSSVGSKESRTSVASNKLETPKSKSFVAKQKKKKDSLVTSNTSSQVGEQGPENGSSQTTLNPVAEVIIDFKNEFDLDDEDAWTSIPPEHMPGRFLQYRNLTMEQMNRMQEDIDQTVKRTVRKINTLKAQFHEHKEKWHRERALLIEQAEQSSKLQLEAEDEADRAMSHLESFINEQEKLDDEEESRRGQLDEMTAEGKKNDQLSLEETKAELAKLEKEREAAELQKQLLKQTDDAKAELFQLASGKISPMTDSEPDKNAAEESNRLQAQPVCPSYKESLISSIRNMLDIDNQIAKAHQKGLEKIRNMLFPELNMESYPIHEMEENGQDHISRQMTDVQTDDDHAGSLREIFTLLCHLSHEIEKISVDPSSFYTAFGQIYEDSYKERDPQKAVLFTLENSNQAEPEKLRKVTMAMKIIRKAKSPSPAFLADRAWTLPLYSNKDETMPRSRTDHFRNLTKRKSLPNISEEILMHMQSVNGEQAQGSSSARSRASVLGQHKSALASLRNSADERRAKSPAVQSLRSQKSVLSDAVLDEDGDMPFPPDTNDVGTSPMTPTSLRSDTGKGIPMYDHPIVQEYMKAYEGVLNFKDNLARYFEDKEMPSASQILAEHEAVIFDQGSKVQPQIEKMTNSIFRILEESSHLVLNMLNRDRDYPVSSLNMSSRDQTRILTTRERTPESVRGAPPAQPDEALVRQIHELTTICTTLEQQLNDSRQQHQDEVHHNTVVMMEMQNNINSLRRELSASGKDDQQQEPVNIPASDSPLMFTRLDSERNSKLMKRAVNEQRLSAGSYKVAVNTMKEYVSLPAKRFVHLVQKYTHHRQMKQIEANVGKSKSLNDDVFMILDKMEALQNMRAQKWADKMDNMAAERLRLASLLMQTLDNIERQSGIFLIKPLYSYRGDHDPDRYTGPVSVGHPTSIMGQIPSSFAPVPTPASHIRDGEDFNGEGAMFMPGMSTAQRQPTFDDGKFMTNAYMNTPRLLELDINRMLIGQNHVSTRVPPGSSQDDRVNNALTTTVRSYITVNRPGAPNTFPKADRIKSPPDGQGRPRSESSAPQGKKAPHAIPSTPPLPPISPSPPKQKSDLALPPHSPPGSTIEPTPPATRGREHPPTTPAMYSQPSRSQTGGIKNALFNTKYSGI